MRYIACVIGLMVLGMVAMSGSAHAEAIVSWDWNDGTTQGWQGSSGETNVAGRLLASNEGNGSLQMFGPFLTGTAASDWSHLSEIRFDVEMVSYSGISSPGEFTSANISLHGAGSIGPGMFAVIWDLDVTGWEFGQIRTFVVPVSQASQIFGDHTKEQILANVESANLLFSRDFLGNTSSAYVDNFIVTAAPESSSLVMLLSASMLISAESWRRRSVQIRNNR